MRSIITAIDIGTNSVTTLVCERTGKEKIRVLGLGRVPAFGMRKGAVADIEEVSSAVKKSLKEAERSSNVKIRSVIASIGGTHVGAFTSRGVVAVGRADGEISDDDVKRVLAAAESLAPKNPNRDIIHIIPKEFRIDNEGGIKDPVGMVGIRLEADALIVDGLRSAYASLIKCIESSGVTVEDVIFAPLAAAEAALSKRQKELGVMLLDIGAGTSDFAIYEEGRLLSAGVFSVGGNHITNDIAIGLKTAVSTAEAIKLRFGHSLPEVFSKREVIKLAEFVPDDPTVYPQRDLAEIIEARFRDIFELGMKELKRVDRVGLLPAGVVLIGGAARIPGVVDLAKRELRLPVEIGSQSEFLEGSGEAHDFLSEIPVALGLVAWHLNRSSGKDPYFYATSLGRVVSGFKNWLRYFLP